MSVTSFLDTFTLHGAEATGIKLPAHTSNEDSTAWQCGESGNNTNALYNFVIYANNDLYFPANNNSASAVALSALTGGDDYNIIQTVTPATVTTFGRIYTAVCYNSNTTRTAYICGYKGSTGWVIEKITDLFATGATITTLVSATGGTVGLTPSAGVQFDMRTTVTSAPATIKLEVKLHSSGTWLTVGSTTDTTYAHTGNVGMLGYDNVPNTNLIGYQVNSYTAALNSAPSPATGYSLTKSATTGATGVPVTLTYTLTPSGGTSTSVVITPAQTGVSGSFSPTTVTLSTATPSAAVTFTPTTAGTAALTSTNSLSLTDPASQNYVVTTPALATTTVVTTANTSTGMTLSTTASGGAGGYTYQWYVQDYYQVPGGGNAISGATSTTYTDTTSAVSKPRWYGVKVTDSAAATVTTTMHAFVKKDVATKFATFGDSILQMNDYINPPQGGGNIQVYLYSELQRILSYSGHYRDVTVTNCCVSGSRSSQWVSGSTNLTNAFTTADAAGATMIILDLGANDAFAGESVANFVTYMTNIIAACLSHGYVKVYVVTPHTFGTPKDLINGNDMYPQYAAQIAGLCNGTTVIQVSRNIAALTAATPPVAANAVSPTIWLNSDGVHPYYAGFLVFCYAISTDINNDLYPTGAGTGTTITTKGIRGASRL